MHVRNLLLNSSDGLDDEKRLYLNVRSGILIHQFQGSVVRVYEGHQPRYVDEVEDTAKFGVWRDYIDEAATDTNSSEEEDE